MGSSPARSGSGKGQPTWAVDVSLGRGDVVEAIDGAFDRTVVDARSSRTADRLRPDDGSVVE